MEAVRTARTRNHSVDIVRGLAMLLVVLGHTISGTCTGYENTFLFRVIWTLQMPMFFIISGYVTRYSKPLTSADSLLSYLRKRTLAYLLPWIVWTFLVRGFIFREYSFFNIRHLLWHMDNGYWFLVSLWTIVVIYGLSDWLTFKCGPKTHVRSLLLHLVFAFVGMMLIAAIGMYAGMSFFSIKLSLYYLPLFMSGYVYGQIQDSIKKLETSYRVISMASAVSLAGYLFLIIRINFYNAEPSVGLIILRYMASISGCVAVMGLTSVCYNKIERLSFAGRYSLEIYLLHYLLLVPLPIGLPVQLLELQGFVTMLIEYLLTLTMVIGLIYIISRNRVLNKVLFYKEKRVQ